VPGVGNFYKGLAVSVPAAPVRSSAAARRRRPIQPRVRGTLCREPFVRVMPLRDPATLDNGYFDVQAANDTNRVDIFVFAQRDPGAAIARLDNLGKGAAALAVQSMNVHLGVDETLGLA
jgi:N-acetyl-gamma-glutamyl-phosphate reductase